MGRKRRLAGLIAVVVEFGVLGNQPNGVANGVVGAVNVLKTPLMGWSSWNTFECNITEGLIKETAGAMVEKGFKDAGYNYLNIDDCWASNVRTPRGNGSITWDARTFPSGPAITSEIHSRGLMFGIYSSAGSGTCQSRAGSLWNEEGDVEKFAEWGVDYVKYDNCDMETPDAWSFPHGDNAALPPRTRFSRFSSLLQPSSQPILNSQSRPIAFGMCAWGFYKEWEFASSIGSSTWRIQEDIGFCWDYPCRKVPVLGVWDRLAELPVQGTEYAGPEKGWNDLDMLAIGVPESTLSGDEERAHFTMWSIVKSPLILGCDLRTIPEAKRAMVTNAEVIAINQDPLGQPARRVYKSDSGEIEIWTSALLGNQAAVMLLNRAPTRLEITLDLDQHLKVPNFTASSDGYFLRDIWASKELGIKKGTFTTPVASHGVVLLRIRPAAGATTTKPAAGPTGVVTSSLVTVTAAATATATGSSAPTETRKPSSADKNGLWGLGAAFGGALAALLL